MKKFKVKELIEMLMQDGWTDQGKSRRQSSAV